MNKPLLILTLTALGCGIAAARFHSQLRAERQRSDELQTRIAHLESSQAPTPFTLSPRQPSSESTVESRQTAAPTRVAMMGSLVPAAQESPPPAALTEEKSTQTHQRFINRRRELMKDPEYRQAMRMQYRSSMQLQHPDLRHDLDLSQEQADRLLDLLVDQQMRAMEIQEPFSGDRPTSQADIAKMQTAMQQRHQADRMEIAALLGDSGLQQWEDYQNSLGARMRVRQLSAEFDSAGIPLRQDQRLPLRDTLAQFERQATQEAQRVVPSQRFDRMTPLDQLAWQEEHLERTAQSRERARDAVAHILTAEQLARYQEIQEREIAMRRADLRIQRAELEGQEDPAAANTVISVGGNTLSFSSSSLVPAVEVAAEQ